MKTRTDALSLLFAVHLSDAPCTCHRTGYCAACGTFRPAVSDPEVLDAVAADARRRPDRRVMRKRLDD